MTPMEQGLRVVGTVEFGGLNNPISKSRIKNLIDELKIDRSFVSELENNTDDQAIVQAILGLASNLNIKIIAEGIETQQQQQFLQNHHCTYGQGYLYQRPVEISEFISLAQKLR